MHNTIENIYVENEQILCQMYGEMLKKRRYFLVVMCGLGSAWLFFCGWILEDGWALFGAVIYMLLTLWYFLLPWRVARKTYRNMLKYYDGNIPATVVRFEEKIVFTQGDSVCALPYDKIKKVVCLEDCVLLRTNAGGNSIVANDGFTCGSKQEMIELLRKNCPQAKIQSQ